MNKLSTIASNVIGDGGEYIAVNDLIAEHPAGVTINGVSLRNSSKLQDIPCFTFAEDPTKYFYAISGDLAKLYNSWLAAYGSIEDLNEALNNEHVKIKIAKVKTKSGNTYTRARLIETVVKSVIERADNGEIPMPF